MDRELDGAYETLNIKRFWTALRPDGQKAILIETHEGRRLAIALPDEAIQSLLRELAKLLAAPKPPNKPNA